MKTIRKGDAGRDVLAWQNVLVAGGKPTRWTNADGEAREWPAAWKWPIARDGIFGE